ncbi:MBOAT family protein [Helicobacter aurati]|uniref:MBOAT family protein n=1 Tax=Helicobacter aurati TaxID=137778 RepID=A0A3D8J607_9HELI|nr:MBOAT family O-acyltransferase [Helicobacter aurati]RDU72929.1 MBOAT family protein [Helicobacter aurati]
MLFNSALFLFCFLPITWGLFHFLKSLSFRGHWLAARLCLLSGSLAFYAYWKLIYLPIMLSSILINFVIARKILTSLQKIPQQNPHAESPCNLKSNPAKFWLLLGVCFNAGLLGFFKYTDFFLENWNLFSQITHLDFAIALPHILLPFALSFVTFQQIAFLVDCYKNEVADSLHFLDYCLFVTFFPQLIAGPIVHHREMMPQFARMSHNKSIVWENVAKGIFIFAIGLFKKVCIADSFAKWANVGFHAVDNGQILNIFESWATSLSYTFQLYFDFSGYCDMAIGLGLLFGIRLPYNFLSPYKATNIADFWRKWHITLGRFLKDYLYIPLGGNKRNKILTIRNLFIVAVLSGVWHGAGWGFVLWGILHGLAMCIHRIYTWCLQVWQAHGNVTYISFIVHSKLYKILCWILTFNFINIAWVFFRAESLQGAVNLLKGMFGIVWVELPHKARLIPHFLENIYGRNETVIYLVLAFIICLCLPNSIQQMQNFRSRFVTAAFTVGILYFSIIVLVMNPYSEFLYFNF